MRNFLAVLFALFVRRQATDDEKQLDRLFEQYKLFVATSESLVARRQGENRFYLTATTLVLGAIGLFLRDEDDSTVLAISVIGLSATGVVLSYAWFRTIQSYRQLNTGKFEVIHALEARLPAALFKDEWLALGEGKDKKRYRPFTKTEERAPFAFALIHVAALVLGILIATGEVDVTPKAKGAPGAVVICGASDASVACKRIVKQPAATPTATPKPPMKGSR